MGKASGEVGWRIILSPAYSLYLIGVLPLPSPVVDLLYHLCSSLALSYWQNRSLVHSGFPWTAWPSMAAVTQSTVDTSFLLPGSCWSCVLVNEEAPQAVRVTQAVFFPPHPSGIVFYVFINRLWVLSLSQRNSSHFFLSQKNLSCLWSVSSCHFWSLLNSLQ